MCKKDAKSHAEAIHFHFQYAGSGGSIGEFTLCITLIFFLFFCSVVRLNGSLLLHWIPFTNQLAVNKTNLTITLLNYLLNVVACIFKRMPATATDCVSHADKWFN